MGQHAQHFASAFEVPVFDLASITEKSAWSLLHRDWFSNLSLYSVRLLNCYMLSIEMLICLCLVRVKLIVLLNICVLLRFYFLFSFLFVYSCTIFMLNKSGNMSVTVVSLVDLSHNDNSAM